MAELDFADVVRSPTQKEGKDVAMAMLIQWLLIGPNVIGTVAAVLWILKPAFLTALVDYVFSFKWIGDGSMSK